MKYGNFEDPKRTFQPLPCANCGRVLDHPILVYRKSDTYFCCRCARRGVVQRIYWQRVNGNTRLTEHNPAGAPNPQG